MTQLAATTDPYALATAAATLLASNPNDPAARSDYLHALTTLKLLSVANRITGSPQASTTTGLVPWQSRARRFAANLKSLESINPQAAALIRDAAAQLPQYELHQSVDGNFHILHPARGIAWLPNLANHKADTLLWQFDRSKLQMLHPIAFDSLGLGWLFLHVLETTANSFLNYSCALYVLEHNPLNLAILFHLHDLQSVLTNPRVRLFVDVSAPAVMAQFQSALLENPTWSIPAQFIRCPLLPAQPLPLDAAITQLRAARDQQRQTFLAQINAHYKNKDAAHWHARFEQAATKAGPPLRILAMTSRYTTVLQHSIAEMASAMRDSGCDVQLAIEPDDQSLENPYIELLANFKPDLLLQLSRLRFENPHLPKNIPFLCWDQDNLPCTRDPKAAADFANPTFVAGHGALFGAIHLDWPLDKCIFCYPTGKTRSYKPRPATPQELARFGCDFSYVSHASGSPEQLRDKLAPQWSASSDLSSLFQATCERVLAATRAGQRSDSVGFRALIRQTAVDLKTHVPQNIEDELLNSATLIADRAFRHETLAWTARFCDTHNKTLRIYGNGWESHPTLARFAAGPANPGEDAQAVFRASRINLQIIETGILHSRLLDGWASGGFFLIRDNFLPGEDRVSNAMWTIAQLTWQENIRTLGELETRASATLREAWQVMAHHYTQFDRHIPFPGFAVWRSLPPSRTLIPFLSDILFDSEARFAELATRYLENDHARAALLPAIQTVMHQHFSYDARWQSFHAAIRESLRKSAATLQPA